MRTIDLDQSKDPAEFLRSAAQLFAEYAAQVSNVCGPSLAAQGIDRELATLPGKYAPPWGRILLAFAEDGDLAGCIALRPIGGPADGVCELKRMYVREAWRRRGLARALARRLIDEATRIGYRVMKLDTSSSMREAIALYESLGFARCERYNDDPMDDTLWFERRLGQNL